MPLYNFATYADTREEWAIRATDLEQARARLGDPNGDWLDDAWRLDAEAVECRDEFVMDETDEHPAIEEITPDHWAHENAHREWIDRSVKQNTAAIAVELHQHRSFDSFYQMHCDALNGFAGIYDFCIALAETLTSWELANGVADAYEKAGISWIEVVEDFTESVLQSATANGSLPDPATVLAEIQVFSHLQE